MVVMSRIFTCMMSSEQTERGESGACRPLPSPAPDRKPVLSCLIQKSILHKQACGLLRLAKRSRRRAFGSKVASTRYGGQPGYFALKSAAPVHAAPQRGLRQKAEKQAISRG